jgi:hypothetical protein
MRGTRRALRSPVGNPWIGATLLADDARMLVKVTLKLPDELVRETRQIEIYEGTSLSAVVADLLSRKLDERRIPRRKAPCLAESLLLPEEPAWFAKSGFPLTRSCRSTGRSQNSPRGSAPTAGDPSRGKG